MLERRVRKSLGNDFQAHTLLPEDLIGLKLQAMVNDPSREPQELVDISSLLNARKHKNQAIDWDLLEEYFALFSRQKQLDQLKQTHG
ncbi:MAG: hypothetical protein ACKVGW_16050 [Verrucomicrobiia bacterium]|jgi:hypothetical protein|tara:strand:- start:249 stop:509 length:261 start_codon:yes stop_codon:yes gene_type:complete